MKTSQIVICILLVAFIIMSVVVASFFIINYNRLVDLKADVALQYSQIQINLQRRVDLIPNYLETVKAEVEHDEVIVALIAEVRSSGGKVISSAKNGDIAEAEEAITNYDLTVDNYLNFIIKNFPELSAGQAFQDLRDELAGTENRVSVSRMYYNEAVDRYNRTIQKFPGIIFANIMGFEPAESFTAVEGSEVSPTVKFD